MRYNERRYNEGQYQYFFLADITSFTDILSSSVDKPVSDSVFLGDVLTKQFTNKGLTDTAYFLDWLSKKRTNETEWSD